jgi:hypothetical protein
MDTRYVAITGIAEVALPATYALAMYLSNSFPRVRRNAVESLLQVLPMLPIIMMDLGIEISETAINPLEIVLASTDWYVI